MRDPGGAMTWTEITAANPFPSTVAVAVSFRKANGSLDPRFFAVQMVGVLGQARFVVLDTAIPAAPPATSTSGWFFLHSSPTPVVPAATIYWARDRDHVSTSDVPIQQLAADGYPLGDAAAGPPPPPPPPPPAPLATISRPPSTARWADAVFGEGRSQTVLEYFERAESAAGEGVPLEPSTFVEGVLVDDEADEFRRRFREPPER
jgi:hypothetical protein